MKIFQSGLFSLLKSILLTIAITAAAAALLSVIFTAVLFSLQKSQDTGSADTAVKPEDRILMVNDKLYYGTNETGPMGASVAVEGKITSTVKADEIPVKNGQSNFGEVGAFYTADSDLGFVMVLIQDEWYVFYTEA